MTKQKSLTPLLVAITSVASGCIAAISITAMVCATVAHRRSRRE